MQPLWVTLDDSKWLFDEENLTLADYFVIKAATGMGRIAFINGIFDEDPAALQALVWFLRRKTEPDLALVGVNFKPAALDVEPVEQPDEEPGTTSPTSPPSSEQPPGPSADATSTAISGTAATSASSVTATSTPSPATSASTPQAWTP